MLQHFRFVGIRPPPKCPDWTEDDTLRVLNSRSLSRNGEQMWMDSTHLYSKTKDVSAHNREMLFANNSDDIDDVVPIFARLTIRKG
jgi:hypothetical protein